MAGKEFARPRAHELCLVADRPHRNEPLARPTRRLADRRCVGRVVLVAPDIRVRMRRQDQLDLETERQQFAAPSDGLMSTLPSTPRITRAWRRIAVSRAPQLARDDDLAPRVDVVNLEDVFRQIEPDGRDSSEIPDRLAHGRLPFRWGVRQRASWHADAVRGAVHPISNQPGSYPSGSSSVSYPGPNCA